MDEKQYVPPARVTVAFPESVNTPLAGAYDPVPVIPAFGEYGGPQGDTGAKVSGGAYSVFVPVTVPPLIVAPAVASPQIVEPGVMLMSPLLRVLPFLRGLSGLYGALLES